MSSFSREHYRNWIIGSKQYLKDGEEQRETKFFSVIDDVYTQHGTNEIVEIFGDAQVFGFPKPSKLIIKLLSFATEADDGDIVLDFFAGSGATGQAVLDLNNQDGGNRKFILVQLPEPCEEGTAPRKAGYKTIAEVTKERVRRVITKLKDEAKGKLTDTDTERNRDRGFRVFKLSESNFKIWNANVVKEQRVLESQLELHINHVREGRGSEDLLYEVLLKSGFPLSTMIDAIVINDKAVYSVSNGEMLIFFEKVLTQELIKAIAEKKPWRVICLDEGFAGNDQLKTNAVQIMKSKGVTSFRTV